jgi:hypothetical protein
MVFFQHIELFTGLTASLKTPALDYQLIAFGLDI